MAYLIEKLVGEGAKRRDEKRMITFVRPLPSRPRDLFDLIAAQGQHISFESLIRGVGLKQAEPAGLVFTTLGRWPTRTELAELPTPYNPRQHLRQMLLTREFRRGFTRRLLDAFPERKRLVHVRIARSANAYIDAIAPSSHPVLPLNLGVAEEMDLAALLTSLGAALHRFPIASTVFMSTDRAEPWLFPVKCRPLAPDTLDWNFDPPAYRLTDLIFAVLRDPEDILISQANALAKTLQDSNESSNSSTQAGSQPAQWRQRLGALPPRGDRAGWKMVTQRILAQLDLRDPICTALGDGTAATAQEHCRIAGITLVGFARLTEWVHTALGCEPAEPMNAAPPLLRREDLDAEQRAGMQAKVAEDRVFFQHFSAVFKPNEVAGIRGSML